MIDINTALKRLRAVLLIAIAFGTIHSFFLEGSQKALITSVAGVIITLIATYVVPWRKLNPWWHLLIPIFPVALITTIILFRGGPLESGLGPAFYFIAVGGAIHFYRKQLYVLLVMLYIAYFITIIPNGVSNVEISHFIWVCGAFTLSALFISYLKVHLENREESLLKASDSLLRVITARKELNNIIASDIIPLLEDARDKAVTEKQRTQIEKGIAALNVIKDN